MSSNTSSNASTNPRQGFTAAVDHMLAHKIDTVLWITRCATVIFTVLYLIPLFGASSYNCYIKALMSNAATSALRLHQRLPNFRFSREFLGILLMEDSCHYLFYSLIFLYCYPMTLVLLPVALFGLLHFASYSLVILDKMGMYSSRVAHSLMVLVQQHQRNILRLVAITEVSLMPFTIFMLFTGRGSLLVPFVYYRFLTLRYVSRRNPYTRTLFHEMKVYMDTMASRPGFPAGLRQMCYRLTAFISKLAPPVPQQ